MKHFNMDCGTGTTTRRSRSGSGIWNCKTSMFTHHHLNSQCSYIPAYFCLNNTHTHSQTSKQTIKQANKFIPHMVFLLLMRIDWFFLLSYSLHHPLPVALLPKSKLKFHCLHKHKERKKMNTHSQKNNDASRKMNSISMLFFFMFPHFMVFTYTEVYIYIMSWKFNRMEILC